MKEDFTKNDWDHFHDCIFHVTNEDVSMKQMELMFGALPEEMKEDAYEWGMSDTLWRDNFIEWMENKSNRN